MCRKIRQRFIVVPTVIVSGLALLLIYSLSNSKAVRAFKRLLHNYTVSAATSHYGAVQHVSDCTFYCFAPLARRTTRDDETSRQY